MRKLIAALAALVALTFAPAAFADGPLPPSLRSAGVTQEQWDALQTEVRRVAARANVSERALASVAERLGLVLAQDGRRVNVGDILGQLDALATRIAELELRLAAISRDEDPAIAALVTQARAAVGVGDLDAADASLADARRLRAERNAQLQAQLSAGRLEEAAIVAAQAEVALLRADYLGAAARFEEAADLAPEGSRERWQYTMGQAVALYQRGLRFETSYLEEAVRVFETRALAFAPRETMPEAWARTQNDLGNTLRSLSDRGAPGALDRSVRAFEAALSVFTREANPALWAMAQMNLANALARQGMLGAPGALERAIAAYEASLSVAERDANPFDWALTQMNLGAALSAQAMRGAPGALERAIACYEAALTVFARETFPEHWAMTQMNLAIALSVLGERGAPGALERAVAAYEAALTVMTREANPAGWAQTQMNLGSALNALGQRGAPNALDRAIAAYEAAQTVMTRETNLPGWALAQMGIGNALGFQGGMRGDRATLERAVAMFESVLATRTREADPGVWAQTQNNLGMTLNVLGQLGAPGAFDRSIAAFNAALAVRTRSGDPAGWAQSTFNLGFVYGAMGRYADARAAVQSALQVFEQFGDTASAGYAREFLARLPPR